MPTLAPELKVSQWLNTSDPITLAGLRGKVVVIEVFQMLCPGCVSHGLPQASRVLETFSPQDVTVLGLHSVFEHREAQGSRAALQAFMIEYRIRFPVAIDAHTEGSLLPDTMQAYHLQGTPSLVLIDRQGQVAQTHLGVVSELALGAQIMRLIGEFGDS
ncbi:MAG: redoxin domain-containing protein [Halioglobus sp.]